MPRVIKPPEEKERNILQSNIEYLCKMQGVSEKSLKTSARLSDYQYRQRKKDPGNYTYENLLCIAKRLHTTVAELITKR
jgi:hypothetical protein